MVIQKVCAFSACLLC